MILTERPRLQPRTLSPINEGQFFLQLDPAARLDPHSAFTIVAIQRLVQPRASVASILLFSLAECLTLRLVGCNEMFGTASTYQLLHELPCACKLRILRQVSYKYLINPSRSMTPHRAAESLQFPDWDDQKSCRFQRV